MEYLLYVDSRNRDTSMYPYGNNYVLNLVTPIRNVSSVELLIAKIPNTIYNITNPLFLTYSNAVAASNLYIPPGFYNASNVAATLNSANNRPTLTTSYLASEGKLLFVSTDTSFSLTPLTAEGTRVTGITGSISSAAASTFPEYANNAAYTGKYLAKSSNVVDMAVNEFVFLDIEEFRTNRTHDARKFITVTSKNANGNTIVQQTTDSPGVERVFGMFPMDVDPGQYKVYEENSDPYIKAVFPQRIPKISKLTIRWQDAFSNLLAFNGLEDNSMLLRFKCDEVPVTLERPEGLPEPVEMAQPAMNAKLMMVILGVVLVLCLLLISFMKKR